MKPLLQKWAHEYTKFKIKEAAKKSQFTIFKFQNFSTPPEENRLPAVSWPSIFDKIDTALKRFDPKKPTRFPTAGFDGIEHHSDFTPPFPPIKEKTVKKRKTLLYDFVPGPDCGYWVPRAVEVEKKEEWQKKSVTPKKAKKLNEIFEHETINLVKMISPNKKKTKIQIKAENKLIIELQKTGIDYANITVSDLHPFIKKIITQEKVMDCTTHFKEELVKRGYQNYVKNLDRERENSKCKKMVLEVVTNLYKKSLIPCNGIGFNLYTIILASFIAPQPSNFLKN